MFYCPIHKTSKYQEVDVDCVVDTITNWVCEECLVNENRVKPISNWFHRNNEKLPQSLKRSIKEKPIEHYHVSFMINKTLESYNCYRYLDHLIMVVHIYNHIFGRRMSVQTQRKIRYKDLPNEGPLPTELAQDDNLLRQILK